MIIVYPYGNLAAVDAYFFGVSASTESGLNTCVLLFILNIAILISIQCRCQSPKDLSTNLHLHYTHRDESGLR